MQALEYIMCYMMLAVSTFIQVSKLRDFQYCAVKLYYIMDKLFVSVSSRSAWQFCILDSILEVDKKGAAQLKD